MNERSRRKQILLPDGTYGERGRLPYVSRVLAAVCLSFLTVGITRNWREEIVGARDGTFGVQKFWKENLLGNVTYAQQKKRKVRDDNN